MSKVKVTTKFLGSETYIDEFESTELANRYVGSQIERLQSYHRSIACSTKFTFEVLRHFSTNGDVSVRVFAPHTKIYSIQANMNVLFTIQGGYEPQVEVKGKE